jgi:hypothetical protein
MSFGAGSILALLIAGTVTSGMSVPLAPLQSGRGTVHYFHPPNVVLDLRLASGTLNRIPLSYEEVGQQRKAEIWNATVLAEESGHFLIFTDRFSSNANVQGECGASDNSGTDGEWYLHVIRLTAPMRETFSLNINSCYRSLTTVRGYPKFDPVTHILVVKIVHDETSLISISRYLIGTDGSVEMIK